MKEDEPIVLPPHGNALMQTLSMGTDYSTQFFFSLKQQRVVHSSSVNSWHLAFETTEDGSGILINGGIGMAVVRTDKTDFSEIGKGDYEGQLWLQDDPNGKLEESAFGDWNENEKSRDKIYLVRLDQLNEVVKAIKIKSVNIYEYIFEIADIDNGKVLEYKIHKDPTRVYSYFNLQSSQVQGDVEPIKESWDLLFTRYGFTFYDQNPPLPYIVTGVLTNPKATVAKDSLENFYEIESDFLTQCNLVAERDVIGFDWKYYDFDLGIYHIRQDYNFIIKTQGAEYYKLRFLNFYDDNGLKGTPTFEYNQIN